MVQMGTSLTGSSKWVRVGEKSAAEANNLGVGPRQPELEAALVAKRLQPAKVIVPAVDANWGVADPKR